MNKWLGAGLIVGAGAALALAVGAIPGGTKKRLANQAMIGGADVPQTIIRQLGGMGRLEAMVGARSFDEDDQSVSFVFSGSRKANWVRIRLNGNDYYDIDVNWVGPYEAREVASAHDVEVSMLKETLERLTGVRLSL